MEQKDVACKESCRATSSPPGWRAHRGPTRGSDGKIQHICPLLLINLLLNNPSAPNQPLASSPLPVTACAACSCLTRAHTAFSLACHAAM
eukprot:8066-Pelagomonas_calceolata.AAC.5